MSTESDQLESSRRHRDLVSESAELESSRRRRDLASALADLHRRAGKPTSRAIASAVGSVSHTTVADTIGGRRVPSWPILEKIVIYLEGDTPQFRMLWEDAITPPSTNSGELDRFPTRTDEVTSDAIAKLITALTDTSSAVIQVGSVLLVKVEGTILVRQLTQRELAHWHKNPGLFTDPADALAELQRATNTDREPVPPT